MLFLTIVEVVRTAKRDKMSNLKNKMVALMVLVSTLVGINHSAFAQCKEIIGYYAGWQQYKRGGVFHQKNLDFRKYTILNYSFFSPNEEGVIWMPDPWGDNLVLRGQIDWTQPPKPDGTYHYVPYSNMIDLAHSKGTKVMLSLGGWTLSTHFPEVAAVPEKRTKFASECIRMIREFNFDGIDIDWEFPGATPGNGTVHRENDTENFNLMMLEIRDSLDAHTKKTGKYYLLTAAFHTVPYLAEKIDWEVISKTLDYVNCFGYDFFGAWDPVTNHNAPLYAPAEGDPRVNQAAGFKLLTETYKVPAEKIVLGIGFYGRTMTGCEGGPNLHVKHSGLPDKETFPETEGTPSYHDILLRMGLYERKWDDKAKVPYLLGKKINSFVSYDDPISVEYKANFIVDNNAAGCLIWDIENDLVETKPGSGKILATPLIDKINEVFDNQGRCRN